MHIAADHGARKCGAEGMYDRVEELVKGGQWLDSCCGASCYDGPTLLDVYTHIYAHSL